MTLEETAERVRAAMAALESSEAECIRLRVAHESACEARVAADKEAADARRALLAVICGHDREPPMFAPLRLPKRQPDTYGPPQLPEPEPIIQNRRTGGSWWRELFGIGKALDR